MKTTFLLLVLITLILNKSLPAFDELKCTVDYEFFEKTGENRKVIKLYKDGPNYKLYMKTNEGKPNETKTTSYFNLDENVVYTIIEISGTKTGNKHALETMFVGMMWGIYFLNLPKSTDFTSVTTTAGTETILSKECTIYDASAPPGGTRYYFWNNIMLKKYLNDGEHPVNVVTIQATSINENPVFSPGEFARPEDVQYY